MAARGGYSMPCGIQQHAVISLLFCIVVIAVIVILLN